MPFTIVVSATALFTLTVLQTRNMRYLFKSSALAPLFHGLEGWHNSELDVGQRGGRETDKDLLIKAATMQAMLREGADRRLKFVKIS